MRSLQPVSNRVLVRILPRPSLTPGGLHIPEEVKALENTDRGEVIACGPLVKEELPAGAVVRFKKAAAFRFDFDGEKLGVLPPEWILWVEPKDLGGVTVTRDAPRKEARARG